MRSACCEQWPSDDVDHLNKRYGYHPTRFVCLFGHRGMAGRSFLNRHEHHRKRRGLSRLSPPTRGKRHSTTLSATRKKRTCVMMDECFCLPSSKRQAPGKLQPLRGQVCVDKNRTKSRGYDRSNTTVDDWDIGNRPHDPFGSEACFISRSTQLFVVG